MPFAVPNSTIGDSRGCCGDLRELGRRHSSVNGIDDSVNDPIRRTPKGLRDRLFAQNGLRRCGCQERGGGDEPKHLRRREPPVFDLHAHPRLTLPLKSKRRQRERPLHTHLYPVDLALKLSLQIPPDRHASTLNKERRHAEDVLYPRQKGAPFDAHGSKNSVIRRRKDHPTGRTAQTLPKCRSRRAQNRKRASGGGPTPRHRRRQESTCAGHGP